MKTMRSLKPALIIVAVLIAFPTLFVSGQRSATDTYAITNVRIVPASGPVIDRGTVVIRNGLIAAVGANVAAPLDARVIEGAGLSVYPGLIDSDTNLGMAPPSPSPSPGSARPSARPAASTNPQAAAFTPGSFSHLAGIQPEQLAVDILSAGGEAIENVRNAGITSVLTVPREGMVIGQSALINLAGSSPSEMVVRSPVALHVRFVPLRIGEYPGSLMGVFSTLRQMLLDAQRLMEANRVYERSPRGLRRPEQDKSLVALFPALNRQMPVIMYADREREIRRALDLAQEFNLRVIISGGLESWKVADLLRERDVPVLLSLNYPRRTTAPVPEADRDSIRVLRERVEAPRTAGRLASAKVRFAFQSAALANISDFIPNVVKSIDNGLSREDALRALTIRAAEILGVADRLGSIEVGKIANLTITRGDLFDRPTRIAHVFIDGKPVDLRPVTPPAAATLNASGTWTLSTDFGEGLITITLGLQQEGDRLRGSIQGSAGSAAIANATISSTGEIRFSVPVTVGGQTTEAVFAGQLTANEIRGTVQTVGREPGNFTATRPDAPPRPATPPGSAGDIFSGTWILQIAVGEQALAGTLVLNQEGGSLSGSIESPFGRTDLTGGSIEGNNFRFVSPAIIQGQMVNLTISGTVNGREITGTATSEIGSVAFSGSRNPRR